MVKSFAAAGPATQATVAAAIINLTVKLRISDSLLLLPFPFHSAPMPLSAEASYSSTASAAGGAWMRPTFRASTYIARKITTPVTSL